MRGYVLLPLTVTALLALSALSRGDDPKFASGPQAGQDLPGTFRPFVATGPDKIRDKFHCFVADYSLDPVVIVFARGAGLGKPETQLWQETELGESFLELVAGLDRQTNRYFKSRLHAFVVVLDNDMPNVVTDDDKREDLQGKLQALKKEIEKRDKDIATRGLEIPLCLDSAANLKDYKLNDQAAVTVVLYHEHRVLANFAYHKKELTPDAVKTILAATVAKLVGKKE